MVNQHLGEVALVVGDKTYTLSFSANAVAVLEESFGGKKVRELQQAFTAPDDVLPEDLNKWLLAALGDHHEEEFKDVASLKPLLKKISRTAQIDLVMQAFVRSFPEAVRVAAEKQAMEGAIAASPPEPGQTGTGPAF